MSSVAARPSRPTTTAPLSVEKIVSEEDRAQPDALVQKLFVRTFQCLPQNELTIKFQDFVATRALPLDDASIREFGQQFFASQLQRSDLHPDAWGLAFVHDPAETREKLSAVAGDKYSYAELDDFSDLIARTLQGAPETSKVERRGVQQQTIYLEFSQDRLAAYGLQPADLGKLIQARNIHCTRRGL